MLVTAVFLPESPRWLISTGRTEQAKRTLTKAAQLNRKLPLRASPEEVEKWQERHLVSSETMFRTEELLRCSDSRAFCWIAVLLPRTYQPKSEDQRPSGSH